MAAIDDNGMRWLATSLRWEQRLMSLRRAEHDAQKMVDLEVDIRAIERAVPDGVHCVRATPPARRRTPAPDPAATRVTERSRAAS